MRSTGLSLPPVATPRRVAFLAAALALLAASGSTYAQVQDRLVRRFTAEHALRVPPIFDIAQDSTGFLWIGAKGGLYRYDGTAFRRWAADSVHQAVAALAMAPDGRVAVQLDDDGAVAEVVGDALRRLPALPGGRPLRRELVFDAGGRLWSVARDGVPVYLDGDRWVALDLVTFGGERPRHIRRAHRGVYVLTDGGLWHVPAPAAAPERRFDAVLVDVLAPAPDRLLLLTRHGRILELTPDGVTTLASRAAGVVPPARPIALVERSGTVWASFDRYLLAVRSDEAPVVIGPEDGLEGGGPMLVDREGSLWVGSFAALYQYPEPATRLFHDKHGLPSRHTRFLARSGDVLWVSTWQGAGIVRRGPDGFDLRTVGDPNDRSRPCTDRLGIVWRFTPRGVVRFRGERVVGRLTRRVRQIACARAEGPGLWVGGGSGLFYADARRGTLQAVANAPPGPAGAPVTAVYEDRDGRLWIAAGGEICHAPAAAVRSGGDAGWRCDDAAGAGPITAFHQPPGGPVWAASRRMGVLAHGPDGWRPLPANAELPTRDLLGLVPSPRGGVWLLGYGILRRVRPAPGGWEVVEALGAHNGLPHIGGNDLVEEEDGTLWITTSLGLLYVPPRARERRPGVPRVVLVDVRVDGEAVPLDRPLELPSDRNRLELHFAALSFADPSGIRYQVRLAPDALWANTRGRPSFRWVDLPPGRYRAEVRASVDGRRWSPAPAAFSFRVLPPWYATPWAIALFVVLAGAALWAVLRARIAFLVGLERQRTRIAMDLHDELGSGLGSIGILAGLLASRSSTADEGRDIAGKIAETAEELGHALSDIVWSLDPRTATLRELAGRLAEHGERLFAGDDVGFETRFPAAWPAVPLPLPFRRNLFLIGLEALHNAARHARARRVTLAFDIHGRRWTMRVADDGAGMDTGTASVDRGGRGLGGMRRRAAEIGATIRWLHNADGGTTVVLRVDAPRRPGRWLEGVLRTLRRHRAPGGNRASAGTA